MHDKRTFNYERPQKTGRNREAAWTVFALLLIPLVLIMSCAGWYPWNIFFRRF
jgi:hypothetical protein